VHDDPSVVDLVGRAGDGDRLAWRQLVERYAPLVWAVCRRYGLTRADADDVAATVWLRLVEGLRTIREPAALPGWLATTSRREALQVLKRNGRQIPTDDRDVVDGSVPASDDWLLREERYIALRSAFPELSDQCRRLLSMLFRDPPASYADIGATMEMPIGAIGPTRQRCLDRLRRMPALAAFGSATAGGER
jgi:RNA polymerase sigma factor (sigma-70 family)